MRLHRLRIDNVRNLKEIEMRPADEVNFIFGPNASGKSSLLEAMYILACGKSFRTHQLKHVLRHGTGSFTVSGQLSGEEGSSQTLGVEYNSATGRLRMKAGTRPLSKLAELAAHLPIVLLHQESHQVFTGGPQNRRQFLDWGLFHVEHRFMPAWQRYRRALKQRNRELQESRSYSGIWDQELIATAQEIDRLRRSHLALLQPVFQEFLSVVRFKGNLEALYWRGWPEAEEYSLVLGQSVSKDKVLGFTQHGPHRADLLFRLDGVAVRERLSRGQLKVLVYALFLAQASTYQQITGKRCVLMMDDLSAELDDGHIRALMGRITELGLQVFISSSEDRFSPLLPSARKVFHVEHGNLAEMV